MVLPGLYERDAVASVWRADTAAVPEYRALGAARTYRRGTVNGRFAVIRVQTDGSGDGTVGFGVAEPSEASGGTSTANGKRRRAIYRCCAPRIRPDSD